MILTSIDAGNGFVKAKSRQRTVLFPSTVATEQGSIKFDTSLRDTPQFDNLIIEFEGERYAVGHAANISGRMQALSMGRDRVNSPVYRRLFAAALATTVRRTDSLAVVASLPVEWYNGARDQARRELSGVWQVGYDGITYTYNVEPDNLHIVPEGFGALCSLVLNSSGAGANEELARARVGMVDIGTRTIDLLFFDGLHLHPNKSDGFDQQGMASVWQMVREEISLNYGRSMTEYEIDAAVADGWFMNGNTEIDITAEIARAGRALADVVASHIDTLWQGGRAVNYIILTGGGAWLAERHMNGRYDNLTMVSEGHMANCEGAYRFGLRKKLDNA